MKLKNYAIFCSPIELYSKEDVKLIFTDKHHSGLVDAEAKIMIDADGNFRYNMHLIKYNKFEMDVYFKCKHYDKLKKIFIRYHLFNDTIKQNNILSCTRNTFTVSLQYFDDPDSEKVFNIG